VRFVEREGRLVAGPTASGRGVYTCRNAGCFERATQRRAFARALRRPVQVDAALGRLYTGDPHA
jgi:predicted RNA-binding protein YlxR (DUF448 family)